MPRAVTKDGRPVELFYSYSHKAEELRDRLEANLALLKREGNISGWHDRRLVPGEDGTKASRTIWRTSRLSCLW